MSKTKHPYVVIIEQTYGDGVIIREVRATSPYKAYKKALKAFDIDPDRIYKYVRNWWAVEGTLCQ